MKQTGLIVLTVLLFAMVVIAGCECNDPTSPEKIEQKFFVDKYGDMIVVRWKIEGYYDELLQADVVDLAADVGRFVFGHLHKWIYDPATKTVRSKDYECCDDVESVAVLADGWVTFVYPDPAEQVDACVLQRLWGTMDERNPDIGRERWPFVLQLPYNPYFKLDYRGPNVERKPGNEYITCPGVEGPALVVPEEVPPDYYSLCD